MCTTKDDGELQKAMRFLTSIMPPSCFFTSFWKEPALRFSFPPAELTNVVTTVLMADSISKERETRTKSEKEN